MIKRSLEFPLALLRFEMKTLAVINDRFPGSDNSIIE